MASRYVVEHLNHLGIVAEVCREIGVAAWLDERDPCAGYVRRVTHVASTGECYKRETRLVGLKIKKSARTT